MLIGPHKLIKINNSLLKSVFRAFSMDTEMSSGQWRGVPLCEIIGSQSPRGAPEFPLVSPSHNHTVLYHIPSNGDMGDRPPKPQIGQDKWDSEYVRMPCSNKSLYPFEDGNGETRLKKRWVMIEEALKRPILTSQQLADTILSYNTKFKNIWKFRALHALFNDHLDEEVSQYFFTVTLPQIAKLALDLPKLIQAPIPLLKQHKNHSISLTQQQIASLLANAFFCTFPRRNTTKRTSEYASYPHINFSSLYECHANDDILEKLACICHYFRRVCTNAPRGVLTFSRRSVAPRALPAWATSGALLSTLPVHVDPEDRIEDAHGLIQLDFANKYLGGGVLGRGCVQEEIRFAICPELLISMLFTEVLRPNEALLMIGCERYSKYEGYGRTFRWTGNYQDATPFDSAGRRRVAVLAIDALPYNNAEQQYRKEMVTRELNKAWVGFSVFSDPSSPSLQYPGLATGNWGCGAFGGTPALKSLVQMMAAAEARRPLAYYTFGDMELRDEVLNVYNLLARYNVTVGQLYKHIVSFSETGVRRSHLHSYLQQILIDEDKKRTNNPTDNMDTSSSPKLIQPSETPVQKELNDSPDLFSQDEDQIQADLQSDKQIEQTSKSNMALQYNKMSDSENKMASQTRRLFDELQKFDDENGKLNLNTVKVSNITSKYFEVSNSLEDALKSSDSDIEPNNVKMASSSLENTPEKMAANEKQIADSENKLASTTSRLFDEMQKFDEEHGRLNLSIPSASPFNHTIHNSDVSMKSAKSECTSEVKKKTARKITDYFGKKPS